MTDDATSMMAKFGLNGRRAMVTGAGSGIGRAIALEFAAVGADLILVSEKDNLQQVSAAASDRGARVRCVRADLTSPTERSWVAEQYLSDAGVDVLVNNAGQIRRSAAVEISDPDWYDVVELNLHAAFELSRAAGSPMLHRGSGKIINIASLLSFQGGFNVPSYAVSKHALVGLTRALANEWASAGVNVNAIAPGYVETATTEALRSDPKRAQEILARIPAGRWAKPEDVSGAAVFLASEAASYVHGQVLVVDGGWLSW